MPPRSTRRERWLRIPETCSAAWPSDPSLLASGPLCTLLRPLESTRSIALQLNAGLLWFCSAARVKKSSSRRANASRNHQDERGVAQVLDPVGPSWLSGSHSPERGGCDGFALQDENRHSKDSPPGAPASRGRAAESSEQDERPVLVERLRSPLGHGDVGTEVHGGSPDEP